MVRKRVFDFFGTAYRSFLFKGPMIRITPTLLVVNDATKLPIIYSRNANKSKHYITGSFGKTESVFNMQDHKQHAASRKFIAGPVWVTPFCFYCPRS